MPDKIAIGIVATGDDKYVKFVAPLVESLKSHFPPHDVILFTDSKEQFDAIKVFQPHLAWPDTTLMRYHAYLAQKDLLLRYENVLCLDADMLVCGEIMEEIFSAHGITAVLHPEFVTTFERRRESTAFVEGNPPYYQGCLVGGKTESFLHMCETITANIDADRANGLTAIWQDESHLNHYLLDHPPAKVLSPYYCYPGPAAMVPPEAKIRHLEKLGQEEWKKQPTSYIEGEEKTVEHQLISDCDKDGKTRGSYLPIPEKYQVVFDYALKFRLDTLVETGTCHGDTVEAARASGLFKDIHSIELGGHLYEECRQKFASYGNIHLYQGNSAEVLGRILPSLMKPALFWLDAHWSMGDTVMVEGLATPVLGELKAILDWDKPESVILIDDIRIFRTDTDWPKVEEIEKQLLAKYPGWLFEVRDDIARAHRRLA